MASASSVLELELNLKMFWNCLTHTYMWTFSRTVFSHTIEKIETLGFFWVESPLKKKKQTFF